MIDPVRKSGDLTPAASIHLDTHPLLVVSPHLDDAVFSCGDMLSLHPGSIVVSVFAGAPRADQPLTAWDAACGFASTAEVIPTRRTEDAAALMIIGAKPIWLEWLDAQYAAPQRPGALADHLREIVHAQNVRTVMFPLGLFHEDHLRTSSAMLTLFRRADEKTWVVYADALYQFIPGLRAQRLAQLADAGYTLEPCAEQGVGSQRKRDAAARYESQLKALSKPGRLSIDMLFAPEQYWRLR
jgi:LmbE family N-acetylglucosaminyl deacetylase